MDEFFKQSSGQPGKEGEKDFGKCKDDIDFTSQDKKAIMMEMKSKCGPKSFKGKGGGSMAENCKCEEKTDENDTDAKPPKLEEAVDGDAAPTRKRRQENDVGKPDAQSDSKPQPPQGGNDQKPGKPEGNTGKQDAQSDPKPQPPQGGNNLKPEKSEEGNGSKERPRPDEQKGGKGKGPGRKDGKKDKFKMGNFDLA